MMMDYSQLKALAKEIRVRVPSLLALAPKNDPFYVGTPADLAMARWFTTEIWEAGGFSRGAHLRRLHYWTVSQRGFLQSNGKPLTWPSGRSPRGMPRKSPRWRA